MGGMGPIFTLVLVRCLLGPLGLSGPMTCTSWTHRTSKQSCWRLWPIPGCPPTPTPSCHPSLIREICDITVVVKKVVQNPAVLATIDSYEAKLYTLVIATVNLAWLQSIMRESWWLQYLKLVFLEMLIVTIWLVFQNQVTYDVCT